jgi:hypothetical protein
MRKYIAYTTIMQIKMRESFEISHNYMNEQIIYSEYFTVPLGLAVLIAVAVGVRPSSSPYPAPWP